MTIDTQHRKAMSIPVRFIRTAVLSLGGLATLASAACAPSTDASVRSDSAGTVPVITDHKPSAESSAVAESVSSTRSASDTGAGPAISAPLPALAPARDANQDFLRHMTDHHERLSRVAHDLMMEPAGHASHGSGADPAFLDGQLDAEKGEMLDLLQREYRETYVPRPDATAHGRVSSPAAHTTGTSASGKRVGDEHAAALHALAIQLREGATLARAFESRLTNPEVKALARRMRASQLDFAGRLDRSMGGMKMP